MMAARRRPTHRGIRLGYAMFGDVRHYRIRTGREIGYCTVAGLAREWLEAYVRWLRARGEPEAAMALTAEWTAAKREAA